MTARPRALTGILIASAALAALAGCGGDDASSGTGLTGPNGQAGCAVAQEHRVTIVAKDLAWDVDCVQAPEGVNLTVVVDNQDTGVNHNLHVPGLPGGPATPLAAGDVVQELDLPADDLVAGEYDFVCDVHPNMTGTLEVLAPLPEGPVTTGR